jgi:hypothetical protein
MKNYIIAVLALCWTFVTGCKPAAHPAEKTEVARAEKGMKAAKHQPAAAATAIKMPLTNDGTWVVTASSVERADVKPEKAVDGDVSTRWSSEFKDAQWWIVDFGKPELVQTITILWEDAFAKLFHVDFSMDGQSWDTIYAERNGSGGRTSVILDPRTTRYVRVYCDVRGTRFGFSFYEVQFNHPKPAGIVATASSGNGDYAARFAVDGNRKTRWSSEFRDSEWWQAEFSKPRVVGGLKINWETAFSEKYEVAVSDDGHEWRTVYRVTDGDGQTDLLFFGPVTTKFVRLDCRQRGTGWGNSIWEIAFYDKAASASASSSMEGCEPQKAVDGLPDTGWRSEGGGPQWWMVELPEELDLGGVELTWGDRFAPEYDVEVSADGSNWQTMYREEFGNGAQDLVYFPSTRGRFIRIACRRGNAEDGYELRHFEPKSGEEQLTPLRAYQAAARNAARGRYPMWLLRQQEFWTVVGLPDDDQESLLGETGTIEPFKGGFTVQPFLQVGKRIVTWADVNLSQALVENYLPLPSVRWDAQALGLDIAPVVIGRPGAAQTVVRYRVTNRSAEAQHVRLVLAVRAFQLNPPWQNGGVSRIEKIEYKGDAAPAALHIDGRPAVLLPTPPSKVGVSTLANGDPTDFLDRGGTLSDITVAIEPNGHANGGILYELNLEPGASKDVIIVLPLHKDASLDAAWSAHPAETFEAAWSEAVRKWKAILDGLQINIPEKKIAQVLKSNFAYVLINRDGPWFKPGSRNYNHSWMRDGALTGEAVLRLGRADLVKQFILNFYKFVNAQGWVPFMIMENGAPCGYNPDMNGGEGHEFDSQGEFVFIVRRYFDFTGDRATLEQVYPAVVRALEYGRAIRRMRMTDQYKGTEFWGILPHSNSHEGYFPAKHSYWDDFWMLRGLKDGAYLAEVMGKRDDAQWMREEEADLRRCLLDSIAKVVQRHNLKNIPGCADLGDEDPTSTSIAVMACDETDYLPQDLLLSTFERYQHRIEKRYRGERDSFTPYEARNADVFVRLGQRDRALALIRYLANDCTRPPAWNHLAEVVHAEYRAASYLGDMPHTWVGSDLIQAILSLLAYDRGNALILGAGLDPAWTGSGVEVQELPTRFGRVGYRVREIAGAIQIEVTGAAAPADGFLWVLPDAWRDRYVTVNGQPTQVENGAVRFSSLPAAIELRTEPPSEGTSEETAVEAEDAPSEQAAEAGRSEE